VTLLTMDEWDRLRRAQMERHDATWSGIGCPDCGREMAWSDLGIVLASDPPRRAVACRDCGYTGSVLA
jgi:DNA-directed RNA polymerase subunit RPC12/RpoP